MGVSEETIHTLRAAEGGENEETPVPGAVLVFRGDDPILRAERSKDGTLAIGRASFAGALVDDGRVSRKHVGLNWNDARIRITDFESTNGTTVDGGQIRGTVEALAPRVVRIGKSLIVPVPSVGAFVNADVEDTERGIAGPTLRAAWSQIAVLAPRGQGLFIRGESGAGKEVAARLFHTFASKTEPGPFVAVNCAAIPTAIAERLLFGAKRGAYSGADADAEGFVQAAHGGTLFLDEIAELDLGVQAKLLRVVETKEVVPLGASKGKKVAVRICVATHRDLRSEVAAGRFREDLYFRVGRPEVLLPPLRDRFEEIPWHLARALRAVDPALKMSASFVEECLLRHWPGNVRELASEAAVAAEVARAANLTTVTRAHLAAHAGMQIVREPAPAAAAAIASPSIPQARPSVPAPAAASASRSGEPQGADPEHFAEALAKTGGNVSQAAAMLGVHRNRIRRWLEKNRRGDG